MKIINILLLCSISLFADQYDLSNYIDKSFLTKLDNNLIADVNASLNRIRDEKRMRESSMIVQSDDIFTKQEMLMKRDRK